jgi:DNA-binding transcriptional MerR regulator
MGTIKLAKLTGVTIRQLQGWDETNLISPGRDGWNRHYSKRQADEVAFVGGLRKRGYGTAKLRDVLKRYRAEIKAAQPEGAFFVLVVGRTVQISEEPADLVRLAACYDEGPLYLMKIAIPE